MDAKVLKRFKDRITGDIREVGETISVTEARAKELKEGGFVDFDAPAPKKRTRKTQPKEETE